MSAATQVILLDHNFQFLNVVSIKKAIKLMVKNRVEVISSTDKVLRVGYLLPKVLRLLYEIKAKFNKKIPYSKQSVFVRDDFQCVYCGKHLNKKTATIDHVVPVSKGGGTNYTNCVTSCIHCNNWKGDSLLEQTSLHIKKKPIHPTYSEFMYMKMKTLGISIKDIWK